MAVQAVLRIGRLLRSLESRTSRPDLFGDRYQSIESFVQTAGLITKTLGISMHKFILTNGGPSWFVNDLQQTLRMLCIVKFGDYVIESLNFSF